MDALDATTQSKKILGRERHSLGGACCCCPPFALSTTISSSLTDCSPSALSGLAQLCLSQ